MPSRHDLIVSSGRVTTHARLLARSLSLALPGLLWIAVLVILPMFAIVVLSLLTRGEYGQVKWILTLDNYLRAIGRGSFGWSSDNLLILWRSVVVATVTCSLSTALAYPVSFWIASRPPRRRYLWLSLVVIPLCTNLVVRTYAWIVVLAPGMPPARLAHALGLVEENVALNPSQLAVYLGMISNALPFAVLPIYTNVERMDWSVVEACRDLYASPWRVFRHGILPQTSAGLAVAVILTFVPALGMFVVPDLLGGAKYWLVGNLIQQQFYASRDYPFGAALALMLVLLTLVGLLVMWSRMRKDEAA